eukprot:CAMPEP_0119128140 /NCGR_PEP_ID=MMETSP1310-20130426/6410_1 /TAXON_ID=464262 /ORGANISM="Genus nov. species nov., Strain RCC2339" /LENGTH=258 /DNA_ID=CAMNT_0007118449 /DNA_START=173 /DNA_END=945 /DNA_ORIENTATION=+
MGVCYVCFVALLWLIGGTGRPVDDVHDFGFVLDLGSSGTRIHVFQWIPGEVDSLEYVVYAGGPAVRKWRPGLSHYTDDLVAARQSIITALAWALERIPRRTDGEAEGVRVTALATAGLRQLPLDQAELLLAEVREAIDAKGGRFVRGVHGVRLLEGGDEGELAWRSAQHLLDGGNPEVWGPGARSLGVVDLGGGSTQLAFVPDAFERASHRQYIRTVPHLGREFQVYSHSYENFGINRALDRHLVVLRREKPGAGAFS